QERPDRALCQVPEGLARVGRAAVAWRARAARLRPGLRRCVEALGGSDEDDPQRVPTDAVAEGSAGTGRPTYGRFLLRRGRRVTTRIRSSAGEVARAASCPNRKRAIAPAGTDGGRRRFRPTSGSTPLRTVSCCTAPIPCGFRSSATSST